MSVSARVRCRCDIDARVLHAAAELVPALATEESGTRHIKQVIPFQPTSPAVLPGGNLAVTYHTIFTCHITYHNFYSLHLHVLEMLARTEWRLGLLWINRQPIFVR